MNVKEYYKNKKTDWLIYLSLYFILYLMENDFIKMNLSNDIKEYLRIGMIFLGVKLVNVFLKKLFYSNEKTPLWLTYLFVFCSTRFVSIYILGINDDESLVTMFSLLLTLNIDYFLDKWSLRIKESRTLKNKTKGVKKENQEILVSINKINDLNNDYFNFDLSELDITTSLLSRDDVKHKDLEKLHYEVINRLKDVYIHYDKHARKDEYATMIAKETIVNLMTKVKKTNDSIIAYTDNYNLEILNTLSK